MGLFAPSKSEKDQRKISNFKEIFAFAFVFTRCELGELHWGENRPP